MRKGRIRTKTATKILSEGKGASLNKSVKRKTTFRLAIVEFAVLLATATAFSQSRSWQPNSSTVETTVEQGPFVAAFEWSVEKDRSFVWPFESLPQAPCDAVWMVIERMPRAWPEKHREKSSVPLSYTSLRVNGRSLPRPQRVTVAQQKFRVSLEKGRLRLLFTLPSGFTLDSRNTLIRIKLYQVQQEGRLRNSLTKISDFHIGLPNSAKCLPQASVT